MGSSGVLRQDFFLWCKLATLNRGLLDPGWTKVPDHLVEQDVRLLAVVAAEIADVDIQCNAAYFRPGVNGEMGFRQDHRAGDAGGFAHGIAKGMKETADDGQAMALAGIDAE